MNALSDLGIPHDIRHVSGHGVHTFRFINDNGQSQLFKWYWIPVLGHRSLVYDEATKIAGKNNNFQRRDLYNNIEAGIYPEWEFAVQLFSNNGTFMWNGIDLIQPTQIVPFEMNPLIKLGKLTLNRNPTNFFAEPESISFAPSNVVKGVSFVPDPLLQWRLMSYDDTATHRHNSPNGYLLPINKAIAPINNNYRDGYMQPLLFEGASISTPNGIGGVQEANSQQTIPYTGSAGQMAGTGNIGRYVAGYDWASQARTFWGTLDIYAQQHTVDAYRFELGHVSDPNVTQRYIDTILNPIDNCLARRVAYGIGATMLPLGSGSMRNINNSTARFPSLYPLAQS
jgi:catalase